MRIANPYALACATIVLIQGCADMPSNAVIDDRSASWQRGQPSSAVRKPQESREPAAAPVADPPGFYTVRKGDTLSRISQQFNQSWRDLADWNNLGDPNDIKVGQQLRVVPPEGARMASVPMESGIEVRPLGAEPASASPAPSGSAIRTLGGLKTSPLGNKVAYSDQAMSELQRPEAQRAPEAGKKPADASSLARFVWPTDGKLIRGYDPLRKGIDIGGIAGQPVVAVGDGTVLYAKNMRGYGNLVIVDHSEGLVSAYAHNKTILVKEGQTVTRGQRIAEMGDTDAESVRLHFEIRQLGKPVDPTSFLPSR